MATAMERLDWELGPPFGRCARRVRSQERFRNDRNSTWPVATAAQTLALASPAMLLAFLLWCSSIASAGQLGYVANGEGSVSVFDTDTDQLLKRIPIPVQVASANLSLLLSPTARRLF